MPVPKLILLALFCITALNWSIHWYTQMITYRLFPDIARHMTGPQFVTYHRAYQARLVWAIYIPWSLLMAATIAVVAVQYPGIVVSAWILLALNTSIAVVSVAFAAPVHSRIDLEERLAPEDARRLLRANAIRLAAASISLALCSAVTISAFGGF